MLLEQLRNDVVLLCQELAASGLVVGTSGNVSARDGDLMVVSPSGVDYAELTADLVGVYGLDGTPVEAVLRPTSEMPLHLGVYAATGAAAIVHTHSVAATALSTALLTATEPDRSSISARPPSAATTPPTVSTRGRWPWRSQSQPTISTMAMYSSRIARPTSIRAIALK